MPRALKFLLYVGVFFFSFILFVYWMLPVEPLKQRVISSLEKELGSDFQVKIEELGTYRITGASLENLTIHKNFDGDFKPVLELSRLRGRVGLFSLLFGSPKFSFDARMSDAKIHGTVRRLENGFKVETTFKNLDLGKIPYVVLSSGLQVTSAIEGEVDFLYNAKEKLRSEGDIGIAIEKLTLKKSTIPLGEMGTFPLPDLDLAGGDSSFKTRVQKGAMQVESFKLQGKDLGIDLKGRVFLAPQVSMYRLNLQGTFQFSPKLWEILDPLLPEPFATELKKQKGKDGRLPLSISGQFSIPQIYSGSLKLYPFKPF